MSWLSIALKEQNHRATAPRKRLGNRHVGARAGGTRVPGKKGKYIADQASSKRRRGKAIGVSAAAWGVIMAGVVCRWVVAVVLGDTPPEGCFEALDGTTCRRLGVNDDAGGSIWDRREGGKSGRWVEMGFGGGGTFLVEHGGATG